MNARAHAIAIHDDSNLAAKRLIGAFLLAFLLLEATIAFAGAETVGTFTTNDSQNQFVSDCRFIGAVPKREATHVVSCTTPSGQKTTCDFNQKPANCTVTKPAQSTSTTGGNGAVRNPGTVNQTFEPADSGVVSPGNVTATHNTVEASPDEATATVTADEGGTLPPLATVDDTNVEVLPAATEQAEPEIAHVSVATTNSSSLSELEEAGS